MREYLKWKNKENLTLEIKNNAVIIKKENSEDILKKFFTIARTKGKNITLEELKKIEDESYDLH